MQNFSRNKLCIFLLLVHENICFCLQFYTFPTNTNLCCILVSKTNLYGCIWERSVRNLIVRTRSSLCTKYKQHSCPVIDATAKAHTWTVRNLFAYLKYMEHGNPNMLMKLHDTRSLIYMKSLVRYLLTRNVQDALDTHCEQRAKNTFSVSFNS